MGQHREGLRAGAGAQGNTLERPAALGAPAPLFQGDTVVGKSVIGKPWLRRGMVWLLCAACAGLVACDGESSDGGSAEPEAQVRTPRRPKGEKKAEAAAVTDDERLSYSYNPIGKRDPFRSFIDNTVVTPVEGGEETPLQKYEIDQYKLVGIIWGNETPIAMVEDPEGMGFFLQKDTLIGRNWGKVVRISPAEVIVAEEYRDFEGKLIVNEIPLKLPADDSK